MCKHMNFGAQVNVARLESEKTGHVENYIAEITIHCVDCGKPFQFLGLQPGVDTQGARVSIDGLEANIAITPQGTVPSPLHRLGFNIQRSN